MTSRSLPATGNWKEVDEAALADFREAWSVGGEAFRRQCLEKMDGKVRENHPGQTWLEKSEAKAERSQ